MANLVVGKKTPPKRLESSASVATGSHESFQQANEQFVIEDATEMGTLLIKAEEAARGNVGIIFKAKKIVKVLPSTVLAKMHCKHLEELKVAVEQYTAQLESITINGTMPDDSRPVSLAILKNLLKDSLGLRQGLVTGMHHGTGLDAQEGSGEGHRQEHELLTDGSVVIVDSVQWAVLASECATNVR